MSMSIVKISDALAQLPGNVITGVKARVMKVFPLKSGEGQYGPWTLQTMILRDGTGEAQLIVVNHDEYPPDLQGRDILVESVNHKGDWKGLNVQENTYQGKTELQLKAGALARITVGVDAIRERERPEDPTLEGPERPQDAPQERVVSEHRKPVPIAPRASHGANSRDAARDKVVKLLGRYVSLKVLAYQAVLGVLVPEVHRRTGFLAKTEETIRSEAMNLVIEVMRRDPELIGRLPANARKLPGAGTVDPPPPPVPDPALAPEEDPDNQDVPF